MKIRKCIRIALICAAILLAVHVLNILLTELVEFTNLECVGQKFSSVEDAMLGMEMEARQEKETSLNYCPPYEIKYHFNYEDNIIVLYSYCYDYDGEVSSNYAVQILKRNRDGTLSFDSGFADFVLSVPTENENYYYFTNIDTDAGVKSISFLYLPIDSENNIYVDGVKAAKIPVSIDGDDFYICYAISRKDTFLSNLITPTIDIRHNIEIK